MNDVDPKMPWQNQDLAELYRVRDRLIAAGLAVEVDSGVSDEGDPWFIFQQPNSDNVVVHIARIGTDIHIVNCITGRIYVGSSFREVSDRMLEDAPLAIGSRIRRAPNVVLHPSAFLTAFVAAAIMLIDTDRDSSAHASERIDHDGDHFSHSQHRNHTIEASVDADAGHTETDGDIRFPAMANAVRRFQKDLGGGTGPHGNSLVSGSSLNDVPGAAVGLALSASLFAGELLRIINQQALDHTLGYDGSSEDSHRTLGVSAEHETSVDSGHLWQHQSAPVGLANGFDNDHAKLQPAMVDLISIGVSSTAIVGNLPDQVFYKPVDVHEGGESFSHDRDVKVASIPSSVIKKDASIAHSADAPIITHNAGNASSADSAAVAAAADPGNSGATQLDKIASGTAPSESVSSETASSRADATDKTSALQSISLHDPKVGGGVAVDSILVRIAQHLVDAKGAEAAIKTYTKTDTFLGDFMNSHSSSDKVTIGAKTYDPSAFSASSQTSDLAFTSHDLKANSEAVDTAKELPLHIDVTSSEHAGTSLMAGRVDLVHYQTGSTLVIDGFILGEDRLDFADQATADAMTQHAYRDGTDLVMGDDPSSLIRIVGVLAAVDLVTSHSGGDVHTL